MDFTLIHRSKFGYHRDDGNQWYIFLSSAQMLITKWSIMTVPYLLLNKVTKPRHIAKI